MRMATSSVSAANITRDRPIDATDDKRDHDRRKRYQKVDACAEEDARENVLAELVGAKKVRAARWLCNHGEVDLVGRIRCDPWREDGRENHHPNHEQTDHGGWIAAQNEPEISDPLSQRRRKIRVYLSG